MFNVLRNGRSSLLRLWFLGILALGMLPVLGGASSCESPDVCQGDGEVVAVLTAEDSGSALEICVDDRFEFIFNYAGNAAFDYEITALDEDVVRRINVYSDPPPEGCYDCPSLVHWVFEGYDAGETPLEISIVGLDGSVIATYFFDISVG